MTYWPEPEEAPIVLDISRNYPRWAALFEVAKEQLEHILSGLTVICIEHVGSTSIPDVITKDVLDIDIEIAHDDMTLQDVRKALENACYYYVGECGFPGRHSFFQPGCDRNGMPLFGQQKQNTYVCSSDSMSLRNHRDLKRVLLENKALRDEYGEEKLWLVKHHYPPYGGLADYRRGKNHIVGKILKVAGWNDEDLTAVMKNGGY